MSKILVTGAAGFIGSYIVARFAEHGDQVVGLDNINDYYNPNLKFGRLQEQGITAKEVGINGTLNRSSFPWFKFIKSSKWNNYRFIRLRDRKSVV